MKRYLDTPARGQTGRRVRALLSLGTIVGVGALVTAAAFSDTAAVSAGFTAGTLDIEVNGEQGNPTPYELVFLGGDHLVPGQTVYAPLRVDNVGSVDSELSMSGAAALTPEVGNATESLVVTVAHTTGVACDAGVVAADASPYAAGAPVSTVGFDSVSLAGGSGVDLCFAVTLPDTVVGTGGGSTAATFGFIAEQADV